MNRIRQINKGVLERVSEARGEGRPVHGNHIRRWALELADQYNVSRDYFSASTTWLYKFKKNARIGSRKVTEYISRSVNSQQEEIDERIDQFLSDFERRSSRYARRLIINMDQTPFEYELVNKRTLSFIGERDTRLNIGQRNKMTHSFTSQPMITRDGRIFGKLLLVLQEPTGTFGPRVRPVINDLQQRYGNIAVHASKSGKLSRELIERWVQEVLQHILRQTLTSIDTNTHIASDVQSADDEVFAAPQARTGDHARSGRDRTHTLLVADSWSGETNPHTLEMLRGMGVDYLEIPRLTTRYIQPLDVNFNLQYKKFRNRVFEEALDPRSNVSLDYLTSREGIINLHSLLWNQFGSEAYTDIRYAWHNTDPRWSVDELRRRPPVPMVNEIQFGPNSTKSCGHFGQGQWTPCNRLAFMTCSHCGTPLCLKHFLERVCFHHVYETRAGTSGSHSNRNEVTPQPDDSEDEDIDGNRFCWRHSSARTTLPSNETFQDDNLERLFRNP